ncbi:MAG TPA: phosphomannomutase/phosphoglucomutase [Limnobacter sp.]|uniref:phosphomannomutase/phosphoglucomutase n=1 Tax=Limnobacter sp. TaxID=2003368 RepID=UPI002E331014|nr:phosphomannomutase/phosphoglucomutase [Limnobacter sp.]HEX5485368.1 phosphomannomutase/phosphoglucomutase [Limnobacter sp.]
MTISPSIFKAYDIRGIVDSTLTEEACYQVGRALGGLAKTRGVKEAVVGRDGRLSGPRLCKALADGFMDAGLDVVDIGMVATPLVYFATYLLENGTGVQVTGSHNPPEYNGLKMMVAGETLYGDTIQGLYKWIADKNPQPDDECQVARGSYRQLDVWAEYLKEITDDVKLARPMKIAVDCGNGVAGAFAKTLYEALGCEVIELFCEVDGNFPNHHPDPAHPENLQDLIQCLKTTDAEIGLAFDGDGDRLGVVTKDGQIIYPDRQLILFARDVLSRNPGETVIYDVKCTRHVAKAVQVAGGVPMMWKTGHSLVKAKLRETGAPLAGEMSGHIFFKERWFGFDDGLYAGVRLLEILSKSDTPSQVLNDLPNSSSTPELQLKTAEGENFELIKRLQAEGQFPTSEQVVTIDGVRAEYADGFGLARPSNTTPVVVMRFEADNPEALARIQGEFKSAILRLAPTVNLPF